LNQILAAYAILPDPDPDLLTGNLGYQNLKKLKKQVLPKAPRRLGHMSQFATIGAAACLQKTDEAKIVRDRLGVFHGSALGNINEVYTVQKQIFLEPEHLPSPIQFSVSLSNMSSFFAAVVTGAMGPNQVVSQGELSFEGALLAAIVSGEINDIDFALVGGTDCFFGSKRETAHCLGYSENTVFGEGTGWLLLGRDPEGSLGEIIDIEQFYVENVTDHDNLSFLSKYIIDIASRHRHKGESVWIIKGLRVEQRTIADIVKQIPESSVIEYLEKTGIYPTAAAAAIADLISMTPEPGLYFHIAQNGMKQAGLISFRIN
jgi:hypothetical protein